jgi:hypothetical protein
MPDCGLTNLRRWVATLKLSALAQGAEIVRQEHLARVGAGATTGPSA